MVRSRLLGIDIDSLTSEEFLNQIDQFVQSGDPHQISYLNADCLNKCWSNRLYRDTIAASDLVYADGMGVVWASRLFGHPLPERLNANDLFPESPVWIVSKGGLRKYRYVSLGFCPFQYLPKSGKLMHIPEIQVDIHFTRPEPGSGKAISVQEMNVYFLSDQRADVRVDSGHASDLSIEGRRARRFGRGVGDTCRTRQAARRPKRFASAEAGNLVRVG